MDVSMLRLLFRDGTIYYAIVCVIHLFNLLFILLAPWQFRTLSGSFTQAISTVLVCRIVLNLRKQSSPPSSTYPWTSDDLPLSADAFETSRPRHAIFTSTITGIVTFFEPPTWDPSYGIELEDMR
ncbi:hypothetical protein K439DRAFT_1629391 [Ramaria rubella]|nr:hypothetical protein K439DRAFT_1629391 [Ramaria rubella]